MKKVLFVLSLVLAGGMLWGCGSTSTTNNPNTNGLQYYNITGSIQGKIMDAITGDPVSGSNLKVYLIQGTSVRGPNMLVTDPKNPLCGDYAFSGIPADINTGEIRYRVVVSKPGYQPFEGDVELQATVNNTTNAPIVDNQYNMIGDIYLYPLGSVAGNVSIYVTDPNGLPIPNATVNLKQDVTNAAPTTNPNPSGDILIPSVGLYPSLQAATDAQGLATFTGGTLTIGGLYFAQVSSLTFNGELLRDPTIPGPGVPILVGLMPPTVNIQMVANPASLYVVSASNSVSSIPSASGTLTITFNQPVIIDTTLFTAALSGGSGGVLGAPAVNATLSANGMTLTLTPNFTTNPTAQGATITYGYAGLVRLQSATNSTFNLFALFNAQTGAVVSSSVLLIGY